jgi:fructokinase
MNAAGYRMGIDLGGTKVEAVLLDGDGTVLHRRRIPTPRMNDNPESEYEGIVAAVVELIEHAGRQLPPASSCTIGVGIPGTMNPETGVVQNANTTCLIGRPFRQELESRLGRPIGMENDANCFTLAEALQGAGQGYGMVFGVIMGTGCGGGLCIDGRIHRGRHRIAGEWGHFSVDPAGDSCYCGNPGCVETKISGGGVEKNYQARFGRRLTMEEITRGYHGGDTACKIVFDQFIEDFGRCLGGLISILDPDAVVLGGGLSNLEELYTLGMARTCHYAFHERIQTPVLRNKLGDSAGVFGAAWAGI